MSVDLLKPVRILPRFLYLEPTSVCNLECKMCYTNVINGPNKRVRPADDILDFARRFIEATPPTVELYWCGTGEVFLHPDFPMMVNTLYDEFGERIEQIIQTNGTTPRRLNELRHYPRLDFRISIDGTREHHDWHRGPGTFDKSLDFAQQALDRGCRSVTIRTLLTRDNIHSLDELRAELDRVSPQIVLLPMVPFTNRNLAAVRSTALAINQKDIQDDRMMPRDEVLDILRDKYQDRYVLDEVDYVDNYLSLTTYGVMTCCHGVLNIGESKDSIETLRTRLAASEDDCRSCGMFPCQ